MEHKDYSQCSSSLDLLACAIQKAIRSFLAGEHLIQSLELGHYLYHSTLSNALSDKASPQQVCHAFLEINRYCTELKDCEGELLQLFALEYASAIFAHGQRIHNNELHLHGRNFHKPLNH